MAWFWWDGFDKRMCGKWVSEQFKINNNDVRIFINVEYIENEVKVKFNFDYSYFNNDAFYVEYSYDSLYFFHNDREHRAEYILTLDNENLINCKFSVNNCWGYSGTFKKDIKFTRLSEEDEKKYSSEEDEKKYSYEVELKQSSRIEILREYAEYGNIGSDVKFTYKFDERENMLDIIEKYNLDELVRDKSDVDTAITLLHWFCGLYRHGDIGSATEKTPQAIMKFADNHDGRTNCRGLAIALAQFIRVYNIKAFHITCMPYEEPFGDCHVVVCVYCESIGKYIMLDPSANLYLKNKSGDIIGVDEFRDILIEGGELIQNEGATDWGNDRGNNLEEYRNYMAKNLIRLRRGISGRYGCDEKDGRVILIPEKYMQNEAKRFNESMQKSLISSREAFWQV